MINDKCRASPFLYVASQICHCEERALLGDATRQSHATSNMNPKQYYVYIATNSRNNVLYTGITNNLDRRTYEHKNKLLKGFTSKYNINKLVYYEVYDDVMDAIGREKQIKAGSRQKKIDLIKEENFEFRDLLEDE